MDDRGARNSARLQLLRGLATVGTVGVSLTTAAIITLVWLALQAMGAPLPIATWAAVLLGVVYGYVVGARSALSSAADQTALRDAAAAFHHAVTELSTVTEWASGDDFHAAVARFDRANAALGALLER